MSPLRRVFAFLAGALAAFISTRAEAQLTPTVTIPATGVKHSAARSAFRMNTQINYADCIADDIISFSVNFTNRGSFPLQIWAGNNSCVTATNRTTSTATGCWLLYSALPSNTFSNVDLHVRDILWGQTAGSVTTGTTDTGGTSGTADTGGTGGTSGTADTGGTGGTSDTTGGGGTTTGTSEPTGTLISGSGPEACMDRSGIPAVVSLAVTFMLVDTSNANNAVASAVWASQYKLLAPNPPDTVTATVGDTLLPVKFTYASTQTDATINGYQFYCDPPPGAKGAADAGIDPVATDAGLVTPNCLGSQLVQGAVADAKFKCGTAGVSALTGNATGLVNGISYNVGVAATDTYENVGILSTLSCQVPQPVDGFFKAYRSAGGKAGGGFCSFSPKREPLPLIALLSLASCLAFRRRRAA